MTTDRAKRYQSHRDTFKHIHLHECQAEVVGSAAPVHWVLHDVEGKDCHLLIHQDAKVITWETDAHTHKQWVNVVTGWAEIILVSLAQTNTVIHNYILSNFIPASPVQWCRRLEPISAWAKHLAWGCNGSKLVSRLVSLYQPAQVDRDSGPNLAECFILLPWLPQFLSTLTSLFNLNIQILIRFSWYNHFSHISDRLAGRLTMHCQGTRLWQHTALLMLHCLPAPPSPGCYWCQQYDLMWKLRSESLIIVPTPTHRKRSHKILNWTFCVVWRDELK